MAEYSHGIFIWVLYSKKTGDILKAVKDVPLDKDKFLKNSKSDFCWDNFIVTDYVFKHIYKYSVTKSGIEKKINKFLLVK